VAAASGICASARRSPSNVVDWRVIMRLTLYREARLLVVGCWGLVTVGSKTYMLVIY
jgi:hypothetical protein